jgi:hypothetical protein
MQYLTVLNQVIGFRGQVTAKAGDRGTVKERLVELLVTVCRYQRLPRRFALALMSSVPFSGSGHQISPQSVPLHIPYHQQQMHIIFHWKVLEPSLIVTGRFKYRH